MPSIETSIPSIGSRPNWTQFAIRLHAVESQCPLCDSAVSPYCYSDLPSMPNSPPKSSYYQPNNRKRDQPQQQTADDQRNIRVKATATAMSFAQRKQWEAKAASFQRGMEHVRLCTAGDACGSSLCHSTRRLMRTVASHPCSLQDQQQDSTAKKECRVCKLWDFLTTKQQPLPRLQRALTLQGAHSCGTAWIQPHRLSAGQRRILSTHKEAQRRF